MTLNRRTLVSLLAAAGMVGLLAGLAVRSPDTRAADETAGPTTAPSSLDAIKSFSEGTEELYHKLAPSMIHVRPEIHVETLVPDSLQKDFEDFKNTDTSDPHRGAKPGDARPLTQPRALLRLRRFLQIQLANSQKLDPDTTTKIREAIEKIDALRQGQGLDIMGVVIDSSGHALVHAPLINDADGKKLPVILPDGTDTTATVRGTDFLRGLCVVTLESSGTTTPVTMATATPAAGEMLLGVSSDRGALNWITASDVVHGRHDVTFVTGPTDDRTPAYLFNTDGQLCALCNDRRALPISSVQDDIKAIIDKGSPPRHTIGVAYSLVAFDSPLRDANSALGLQPAVQVTDVIAGSPAAAAGILKGDFILRIDHKPINQLLRILADVRQRSTDVDVDIVRNNQPTTLKMSLADTARPGGPRRGPNGQ